MVSSFPRGRCAYCPAFVAAPSVLPFLLASALSARHEHSPRILTAGLIAYWKSQHPVQNQPVEASEVFPGRIVKVPHQSQQHLACWPQSQIHWQRCALEVFVLGYAFAAVSRRPGTVSGGKGSGSGHEGKLLHAPSARCYEPGCAARTLAQQSLSCATESSEYGWLL